MLVSAGAAAALEPPVALPRTPAPSFTTHVRFINLSPFHRREWGLATVPFPRGVWTPGKSFTAPGYFAELTPFGARWPDGSIRLAQLAVALDLAGGEERLIAISEGAPAPVPFMVSPWLSRGLLSYDLQLIVGLTEGGIQSVRPRLLNITHATGSRAVGHYQGRVPQSDLVCDLWLTMYCGADHMSFELRLTNGSTGSRMWEQPLDFAELRVNGAVPVIRGALKRGTVSGAFTTSGPNSIWLLGPETLSDGQGQEWWGDLFFIHPAAGQPDPNRIATMLAVIDHPLFGVSTDWAASQAYGPFGHIPPAPPWVLDGGRAATQLERAQFESSLLSRGGPWDDWRLGLLPRPSTTGDQHDFGAAKLMQIVASGLPYGIEEARLNASEEALRPVHHRETSGAAVRARFHRSWVSLAGRTHFNRVVSPDRLGKPYPSAVLAANGWEGRDAQHWSSLVLAGAYLLTCSPALRYELDNEAELFISEHTLPSQKPGWSTNAIGDARALGRTLLSMSWNYVCTGRTDLRDHMIARIHEVVVPTAVGSTVGGPVKPISTYAPDPRQLMVQHWRPWEESQAVLGLEACYRVTNEQGARDMAVMAARTLMMYGWKLTPTETVIATAIGWKEGGVPLTATEYLSPSWALWSYGTGFNEWAVPAVKLAAMYGLLYQDYELMSRGLYVYGKLVEARTRPAYSIGWDRFSEWDAVQ